MEDLETRPYWPGAFKVGDRVRVTSSPECFCYALRIKTEGGDLNGLTGTVFKTEPEPNEFYDLHDPRFSHRFSVELDERIGTLTGAVFAATELEPLQ